MESSRINVLYIAGAGRSGSTIVGDVLGNIDSFFHVGELYSAWDVTIQRGLSCGCGQPLKKCPIWAPILAETFSGAVDTGAHRLAQLKSKIPRTHQIPWLLYQFENDIHQGSTILSGAAQEFADVLLNLYKHIQAYTKCTWILDSSKIPSLAFLLSTIPQIRLHVLQLVRDPRAVAYSWRRKDIMGHQPSPYHSAKVWSIRNFVTETFRYSKNIEYSLLRYEDFTKAPKSCIETLVDELISEPTRLPFSSLREVHLGVNHTVWGNPKRTRQGSIKIYQDDEWKTELSRKDKFIVEALTWPLLLRYNYLSN